MSKVYNSAIGAIKAAMLEAGASERDIERLYFHECLVVSPRGIEIVLTILFINVLGAVSIGRATYSEG